MGSNCPLQFFAANVMLLLPSNRSRHKHELEGKCIRLQSILFRLRNPSLHGKTPLVPLHARITAPMQHWLIFALLQSDHVLRAAARKHSIGSVQ